MIAHNNYAKAVDCVSHKKLMNKLQAYSITGDLLNWIKYYWVIAINARELDCVVLTSLRLSVV